MRVLLPVILAAASLAAAPAMAANQFDLVCKGQQKLARDGAPQPVEAHYRVDLAAGSWCRDQCVGVDKIAAAGPDRIAFKAHPKAGDQDEEIDESFERTSGKWIDLYAGPYPPGEFASTEGKCEVAAFSGFPGK